ncbi:hypothetical protein [Fluviispira multicolorata]|uniref:Thiamin pyrophosphokinase catalytic domain-containing protein n=1 Tax=Fluviispira multicolorata TaxID=2654512 RepID=A0A833JE30_9BACT|nr:hypothetical protein [Fluviispira multicolorata]KAB8031847.1 hypothetical protein GCL57_04175 [Fluviispira multicolorata]
MNLKIKKYVVFLNGNHKSSSAQVNCAEIKSFDSKITQFDTLYVADGALNHILRNKISYQKIIWAGDSDSLDNKAKKYLDNSSLNNKNQNSKSYPLEKILLVKNKDFNDFSVLLDRILKETTDHQVFLEIFYGLGGRRDHEVANILEAERFICQLPFGGICFFHGGVVISSLEFEIFKANKMLFSTFIRGTNGSLEILGAEYNGHFSLERPSHGLSNRACGSHISFKPINTAISVYF